MSDSLSEARQAERRLVADRPSPAIPLLVMAAVLLGAIVMALLWPREVIPAETVASYPAETAAGDTSVVLIGPPAFGYDYLPGLIYWTVACALAYFVIATIARRQGYRGGIWVNRRPLLVSGLVAIAIAIVIWGLRERQPVLWAFGIAVTALAVAANLYNMENLLFRLGMPGFSASIDVVNLALMATALLLGSAGFALAHASGPHHALRGAR